MAPTLSFWVGTVPTHAHDSASQAVHPTQRLAYSMLAQLLHGGGLCRGKKKKQTINFNCSVTEV